MNSFAQKLVRLHPVATQADNRRYLEDTHIVRYDIRKGSLIHIDVLSVHFNEELWGPEHHFCKQYSLAFTLFGAGSRPCLGMRFVLMEIKLCLVRLLNEYRILPSSD